MKSAIAPPSRNPLGGAPTTKLRSPALPLCRTCRAAMDQTAPPHPWKSFLAILHRHFCYVDPNRRCPSLQESCSHRTCLNFDGLAPVPATSRTLIGRHQTQRSQQPAWFEDQHKGQHGEGNHIATFEAE